MARSALQLRGVVASLDRGGGGPTGQVSVYTIETTDHQRFKCDYTDIATEGFRTLTIDDPVLFVPTDNGRATFVRHINQPTSRQLLGLAPHSDPSSTGG